MPDKVCKDLIGSLKESHRKFRSSTDEFRKNIRQNQEISLKKSEGFLKGVPKEPREVAEKLQREYGRIRD